MIMPTHHCITLATVAQLILLDPPKYHACETEPFHFASLHLVNHLLL